MEDVFPRHISETVPVLKELSWRFLDGAARRGSVKAFITTLEEEPHNRVSHPQVKQWYTKRTNAQNFQRTVLGAKELERYQSEKMIWDRVANRLRKTHDRSLKNTDTRLGYRYHDIFIVKQMFTFGQRTVPKDHEHIIQTLQVPVIVFETNDRNVNHVRRNFSPDDQFKYTRYVLNSHGQYVVPEGTRYVLLTFQKTVFSLHVARKGTMQGGVDFRQSKNFESSKKKRPKKSPEPPVPESPVPSQYIDFSQYMEPYVEEPLQYVPYVPPQYVEEPVQYVEDPVQYVEEPPVEKHYVGALHVVQHEEPNASLEEPINTIMDFLESFEKQLAAPSNPLEVESYEKQLAPPPSNPLEVPMESYEKQLAPPPSNPLEVPMDLRTGIQKCYNKCNFAFTPVKPINLCTR